VPNFCARPGAPPDPRLAELRRMGMQHYWVEVAEAVGVDAFLAMWRIIDRQKSLQLDPAGSGSLVHLRSYDSYLRFQRNRWIECLAEAGVPTKEIRRRVAEQIGENLTERHIYRLRKRG
jgi:hypothetical protein